MADDTRLSGLPWLKRIPDGWTVAPVAARYEVQLGKMLDEKRILGAELAPYLRNVDVQWESINTVDLPTMDFSAGERKKFSLVPGDLLVCEGGDVGRTAIWRGQLRLCFYQKALHRLRPRRPNNDDPRFMRYLMCWAAERRLFASTANSNTIDHLTAEQLRRRRFAFPPWAVQQQIATFLDRETARLDGLIEKRQRMISLLHEKRAALITHAVTRGLNPDRPLKDSGVEWLGRIPAHWDVMPLKHAVRFQRGHDLPADDRNEGCVPVVSSSGASGLHDRARAKAPGITTGRYGTIGKFTYVMEDYWPLNTVLYSIRTGANNVRFLWWMLHILEPLFVLNSRKSAVPGVDRNDLHPVMIALPPRAEQDEIAASLDARVARVDQTTERIGVAIASLIEYRASLITAAVTGQIDVRALAP